MCWNHFLIFFVGIDQGHVAVDRRPHRELLALRVEAEELLADGDRVAVAARLVVEVEGDRAREQTTCHKLGAH